jgi:hypothetical protein
MDRTWLPADELPDDPRATLRTALSAPLEPTELVGLTLERELGRGGMGVVYAGRQQAMAREVAIKTVRADASPREARHLLREAWLGGRLEHPNIVPVYDLQSDAEGQPQLVMKKLDGTSWDQLLADPSRLPPEATDPVAFHVEVLIAVCRAVEFAHARGVLHRDIKPSNVMIGPFGEVTLLDWGLAVSTAADETGRRHDLEGQTRLCGTPAYMPPEMFYGDFAALGPGTDVYLLGATLYEVLTGQLLRDGPTIDALREVADRRPALPDALPADLRRLLQRCFHPDPTRRGDARDVRQALARHLRDRDAERIAVRIEGALEALEAAIAADDVDAVARHHGACAFGAHELRDRWPDEPRGLAARRRLTRAIVPYLLRRGEVGAARITIGDDDAHADLLADVAAAEARAAEERARVAALTSFTDSRTARFARTTLAVALGSLWLAMPLAFAAAGLERGLARTLIHSVVSLVIYGVALVIFWRGLRASQLNWSLFKTAAAVPLLAVPQAVALSLAGADGPTLGVARVAIDATAVAFVGLAIDRRLLPAGLLYLAVLVAGAAYPAWATPLWMAGTVGLVASLVALYLPKR